MKLIANVLGTMLTNSLGRIVPFLLCIAQVRGDWADAYAKAATALSQLSNTDKVNLATGIGWEKGPCVGNSKLTSYKLFFPGTECLTKLIRNLFQL